MDSFAVDFLGSTAATVISQVKLMDGTTVLATNPGATNVIFTGLNYTIPANTKKTLDVVVTLSTVGAGAGTSGSNIVTTLNATYTKIAPASTGVNATIPAPTSGSNLYVYKSIPTISLVSLPSTTLTAGTKTLQKFTIAADASAPISWNKIEFAISKTAATTIGACSALTPGACTGVILTDGTNTITGNMTTSADLTTGGAVGATTATLTFVPSAEEAIPAGQAKTYELKALTVGGDVISGNYVMSQINKGSSAQTSGAISTPLTSSFIWSDISAQGHTTLTSDWATDFLVKNLPTDSQTLSGTGA